MWMLKKVLLKHHLCGTVELMGGYGGPHGHSDGRRCSHLPVSVPRLHAVRRENQEVRGCRRMDVLTGEGSWFAINSPEAPTWTQPKRAGVNVTQAFEEKTYRKNKHLRITEQKNENNMQYATVVYWTAHLSTRSLSSPVKPTKLRSVPLQFLQKHDFLSHYAAVMFAWAREMHIMLGAEQQGPTTEIRAHRCRKHTNFFDSHQLPTHPRAAAGWCPLCESWAESCPRWWSFSPPPHTLSPGRE